MTIILPQLQHVMLPAVHSSVCTWSQSLSRDHSAASLSAMDSASSDDWVWMP